MSSSIKELLGNVTRIFQPRRVKLASMAEEELSLLDPVGPETSGERQRPDGV